MNKYMIMSLNDAYVGSVKYDYWADAVAEATRYAENTGLTYYIVRIEGVTKVEEPKPKAYVEDLVGARYY